MRAPFVSAFYRADGTVGAATAAMSTPCREAAHMMALLREKFAGIDAGFGVDLLRLDASRVAKRDAMQNGFVEPASAPFRDPTALVDRLANRFGSNAITVLKPRGSHIPERSQARIPALEAMAATGSSRLAYAPPWPYPKGPVRPAFVLARPEPIDGDRGSSGRAAGALHLAARRTPRGARRGA